MLSYIILKKCDDEARRQMNPILQRAPTRLEAAYIPLSCISLRSRSNQSHAAISSTRQAPLQAVKVLALSRNSGGTAGVLRLVLIDGRAFFIALSDWLQANLNVHPKRKKTISMLPDGNRKDL
jgi:hypothetical protein